MRSAGIAEIGPDRLRTTITEKVEMTLERLHDSYATVGGRSAGATALDPPAPAGPSGEMPEDGQFMHFSRHPEIALEQRFDADAPPASKPTGALWVSHEPIGQKTRPYGWYSFRTGTAGHGGDGLEWAYPAVFIPGARVYVGDSVEALSALEREYGASFTVDPRIGLRCPAIDWSRFARDWQAFLVTSKFLGEWPFAWLRGWDCASVAVLDVSILRLLPPLTGTDFARSNPGADREWEREQEEQWKWEQELEWLQQERMEHSRTVTNRPERPLEPMRIGHS